jgi:hypothetical protein
LDQTWQGWSPFRIISWSSTLPGEGPKGEKSIKYLKIFFRTSDDSVMIFGVEH